MTAIIGGSVLVVGSGATGFAYWRSNKLIDQAKTETANDKFFDAKKAYESAAKWWPSSYRKKLAETARNNLDFEEKYQKAVSAAKSSNFSDCVAALENIGSTYPKYQYVESALHQCQDNKNRIDQGLATVPVTVEDPAISSKNTSEGVTTDSSKNKNTLSSGSTSSQNTSQGQTSSGTNSGNASANNPLSPAIPETPKDNYEVPPPVSATIPTSPANQTKSVQPISGYYSTASVESIANSLQLVYNDATGDFVTPPGGADPVHGVYEYAPIDVDNLYAGIHAGRLYFKVTLDGTIAASQATIGNNVIESVTFNIGIDSDGDLMEACATEAVFAVRIGYNSNDQIGYSVSYGANCTGGEMGTHTTVFEKSGHGLAHIYNSGTGKNSIVFSYALSDLADMVNIGDNLNVYISSEAESNLWEHYSYDFNEISGEPIWSAWTAAEI